MFCTLQGSDLASETAAALAAASIVFQKSNSSYANILLTHAKQLFDFANKYRGKYTESITDAKGSYE
jgi:endoglucanase